MNEVSDSCLTVSGIAAVLATCSLPVWRAVCLRANLVDAPGHRKVHDTSMPLAGGLAVFTGIAGAFTWMLVRELIDIRLNVGSGGIGVVILGANGMFLLGLLDDRFELVPVVKFVGQLLIAFAVCGAGVRPHLFPAGVDQVVGVVWMLAVTNAFNFMDNMNGLCAGLAGIGGAGSGVVLAMNGALPEALVCFSVGAAAIGFLPFNYPRASAFLGDSGSHLLGFLMAALSMRSLMWTSDSYRIFIPLLLVAVPFVDLIQVVTFRCWRRQPVWIGDRNHLSHRLVSLGVPPSFAVGFLWIVAILAAGAAVWLSRQG